MFEEEELYNENMKNKVVDFGSDQKERNIKKGYSVMSKRMLISVITVLMMGLCACGGQQGSAGGTKQMTTFYITTKKHRGIFLCAFLLIQVWNVPRGTKLWI